MIYRGIVTDIDDPEGLLRIKAQVPQIYGLNESDWMWPSIPIAVGVQVPPVGNPVWVMLEGGDNSRPVWVGTWRTSLQGALDEDPDIHPDLAAHDTLGLATQAELDAHAAAGDPHTVYLQESVISGLATPAILLGVAAAAGTGTTPFRHNSTIVAFDATAPSTQAFSDAAVVGTVDLAARRDHKHAMPADPVVAHETAADPHPNYYPNGMGYMGGM